MAVAQNNTNHAKDEAAIRAIVGNLEEAWTKGDAKLWGEQFAEDVDFMVWNGLYLKGREAITKSHAEIFNTIYKGEKLRHKVLGAGSISIITLNPINVTTVATGFNLRAGILFDGANIWVTDLGDSKLKKLDASGNTIQAVEVGTNPKFPAFDGTNIWVPNVGSNSVSVVRASTGGVLATLSGNGLGNPAAAAFDGERILVTNSGASSVSLWKAAGLAPIGTFSTGASTNPLGACSDGLNFWVALYGTNKLARF